MEAILPLSPGAAPLVIPLVAGGLGDVDQEAVADGVGEVCGGVGGHG
jgi:hypothetical protein